VYHVDDQLVELSMEALYTVTNHLYFQFHKCETLCQAILKCLEVYVQHNPPGNYTQDTSLDTQNIYITKYTECIELNTRNIYRTKYTEYI